VTAQIIQIYVLRARKALQRFRANDLRVAVDTLYGPAPAGLSAPEIKALEAAGFAEVRKIRTRVVEYRVTLTPAGRRARDEESLSRSTTR
jgi:hypothetical protein